MMEKINKVYCDEITDFLKSEKANSEELILMIMNTINATSCIFFASFNHFFSPDKKIDLKFIKVKLINTMNEEFDKLILGKDKTIN